MIKVSLQPRAIVFPDLLAECTLTRMPLQLKYKIREREGTIIIKQSTCSFAAKKINELFK